MILKCQSFEKMAESIRSNNLSVVMFGCGVIGRITTPEILREYGLLDRIVCFADNDRSLWGGSVPLYGKTIPVVDPETLREKKNTVILLNVSRYDSVLEQLNGYKELTDVPCYLMPMMCIHNFVGAGGTEQEQFWGAFSREKNDSTRKCGSAKEAGDPISIPDVEKSKEDRPVENAGAHAIPKVLNYIWAGGAPLPDSLKRCIESWRKYCPDYEIRQWDESNYDFHAVPYMAEAYDRGVFGFASDYAKIDILYRYGGFCMDTDVELIKPLDGLRFQEAFCGVEKWQVLNFGGLSGATKSSPAIRKYLEARKGLHFINPDGTENRMTCGYYDTKAALEHGYRINGKIQRIDGMTVYPSEYFHPYDYMSGETVITENTYSIHHFGGSWLTPEMAESNRKTRESYRALYEEAVRDGE